MLSYVIYGKIIVDEIRLSTGEQVRGLLGGGGPQAAFGARLWSDSVGLLSRSGTDLDESQLETLNNLGIDLGGWTRFPDIPTPRTLMQYDEKEYLVGGLITSEADWTRLLGQPLSLPPSYRRPKAIHLITEFPDEPMVATALSLQDEGALFSLEPLATGQSAAEWDRMLALVERANLVTPDWPTASGVAGSEDPRRVLDHWSALGAGAVAIRHGARGSYVWSRDRDEAWHVPAVPTKVVDPTGAGNAYGGGLCVGWTETRDIRLAGCYGAIAASILLRQVGLPPMTSALQDEAQTLLNQWREQARQLYLSGEWPSKIIGPNGVRNAD